MGSDPNSCHLAQQPWPARPWGDARAHPPAGGSSQGYGNVGALLPPHSKQLSGWTAGPEVTDPDLQASFRLRKTVSKAPLGVFSPSALPSIQLFFIPFAERKPRLKEGE